ncbi:bacterial transcriptional activator domain-containing protein [Oribacterium sp. HCP28S3_H8]|uniref:bacterial transcriptional activator domain-containing protein n=1 Tax=Oribacterium sp. HCP28S3_H8 TaxID=3438945 RepID=UPI00306C88E8|nr:bacterial transcriptional activator domain-containing protein [Oribacterium sp.]
MDTENLIYVEMLGGFSISVNGQCIGLGNNNKANFLKLIQIVLLHREHGISKRELIDGVFGYKDLLDENNSLNNLLHQARTQMKRGGIPGKKFIEGKKGVFFQEKLDGYTTKIDVFDFRAYCHQAEQSASDEEKAELYQKAFDLYKGELLPVFATDYWVIVESVQLKHMYDELVEFLGKYYREHQEYDKLYQLYFRANQIYPDNGWQINVIDALILRKQYKEAYELYRKTAKYYLEELEVPLPDALMECYNRIYNNDKVASDNIEEIQESIVQRDAALKRAEDGDKLGAYYCQFSSFVDVYHVLMRNLSRRSNSIFMMLCTLVDYEGKPIRSPEKLSARADALKEALSSGLRQGDVYTKYSASQYLILLIGTKKENCSKIYQRISRKLKDIAGPRADFKYRIVSMSEIPVMLEKPKDAEQ